MFAAEWLWQVYEVHSHFLHGTYACNQGHIFEFSTNLYALEHVHVVQIWIMHINALKTQLMHKNVLTNTENFQNLTQHSCCSMLTLGKKLKSRRGSGYLSSRKVKRSLPKPSGLLWEALVCEKHIPKPAPMGQKVYHDMLMSLHDSMPSFMNFRRALDLL